MSIYHFSSLDILGILIQFEYFELLLEPSWLGCILDLDQFSNVGYTVYPFLYQNNLLKLVNSIVGSDKSFKPNQNKTPNPTIS